LVLIPIISEFQLSIEQSLVGPICAADEHEAEIKKFIEKC